jgi:4-amino-4-deoxy-L-arabinose transferase-like glycosyltransferase
MAFLWYKESMLSRFHFSITGFLLGVIVLTFCGFGLFHLDQFETADEHYWLFDRVPKYWNALSDGNWKKTFINDKPGISVALVSGVGLIFEPHPKTLCHKDTSLIVSVCDTSRTSHLLWSFRLPILLLNTLILVFLFWSIAMLSNRFVAMGSVFFMASSPILIGISQIVNPDSLLWSLGAMSLFTGFIALKSSTSLRFTLFAGVFLGLSVLSKYTASIFFPFFILVAVVNALTHASRKTLGQTLNAQLRTLLILFGTAIGVIVFFLPAIWVKPSILTGLLSSGSDYPFILVSMALLMILEGDAKILNHRFMGLVFEMFHKLQALRRADFVLPFSIFLLFFGLLFGRVAFPDWNLFDRIPFDLKDITSDAKLFGQTPNFLESFLLEINPLVFSLTPLTLFFSAVTLLSLPFVHRARSPRLAQFRTTEISFSLVFFVFFILALKVLDVLAIPRYLILLYPIFAFVAGTGLYWSVLWIEAVFSLKQGAQRTLCIGAFVLLCGWAGIYELRAASPFYLNYTNTFLPKDSLISDAWGYGGYEAAQYINDQPNATKLTVWTDYEGVCSFVVSRCIVKQYKESSTQPIDFVVLTRRGEILYNPGHTRWAKEGHFFMKPAYDTKNPDWMMTIHNQPKNFIKVVKVTW